MAVYAKMARSCVDTDLDYLRENPACGFMNFNVLLCVYCVCNTSLAVRFYPSYNSRAINVSTKVEGNY